MKFLRPDQKQWIQMVTARQITQNSFLEQIRPTTARVSLWKMCSFCRITAHTSPGVDRRENLRGHEQHRWGALAEVPTGELRASSDQTGSDIILPNSSSVLFFKVQVVP